MLGIAELRLDFRLALVERVGDILEKDEPEDGMFIDRSIEAVPEPVGRVPEFFVESVQERLFFISYVLNHRSLSKLFPTSIRGKQMESNFP